MKTAEEWQVEHMTILGMSDAEIAQQMKNDDDGHCKTIQDLFKQIQLDARISALEEARDLADEVGSITTRNSLQSLIDSIKKEQQS